MGLDRRLQLAPRTHRSPVETPDDRFHRCGGRRRAIATATFRLCRVGPPGSVTDDRIHPSPGLAVAPHPVGSNDDAPTLPLPASATLPGGPNWSSPGRSAQVPPGALLGVTWSILVAATAVPYAHTSVQPTVSPIDVTSKRIAMIASAPRSSASSTRRSIACRRVSRKRFVIVPSSPPTIDLRFAPSCGNAPLERTTNPKTSPTYPVISQPGTSFDVDTGIPRLKVAAASARRRAGAASDQSTLDRCRKRSASSRCHGRVTNPQDWHRLALVGCPRRSQLERAHIRSPPDDIGLGRIISTMFSARESGEKARSSTLSRDHLI